MCQLLCSPHADLEESKFTYYSLSSFALHIESGTGPDGQLLPCFMERACDNLVCVKVRDLLNPEVFDILDIWVVSKPVAPEDIGHFVQRWKFFVGSVSIPVITSCMLRRCDILGVDDPVRIIDHEKVTRTGHLASKSACIKERKPSRKLSPPYIPFRRPRKFAHV